MWNIFIPRQKSPRKKIVHKNVIWIGNEPRGVNKACHGFL